MKDVLSKFRHSKKARMSALLMLLLATIGVSYYLWYQNGGELFTKPPSPIKLSVMPPLPKELTRAINASADQDYVVQTTLYENPKGPQEEIIKTDKNKQATLKYRNQRLTSMTIGLEEWTILPQYDCALYEKQLETENPRPRQYGPGTSTSRAMGLFAQDISVGTTSETTFEPGSPSTLKYKIAYYLGSSEDVQQTQQVQDAREVQIVFGKLIERAVIVEDMELVDNQTFKQTSNIEFEYEAFDIPAKPTKICPFQNK